MTDTQHRPHAIEEDQKVEEAQRRRSKVQGGVAIILLFAALWLFSMVGSPREQVDLAAGQSSVVTAVPIPVPTPDAPVAEEGATFDTSASVRVALEYVLELVAAPIEEGVSQVTGPAPTLSNVTAHTLSGNASTAMVAVRVIGDLSWDGGGRVAQWTVTVDQSTLTVVDLQVG